jgi:tetratricopeptide (TPR) repeat protein
LGAAGTALALVANFFEKPWTIPSGGLSDAHQLWCISRGAFFLQSQGRLSESLEASTVAWEKALEKAPEQEDWRNFAACALLRGQVQVALGQIAEAIDCLRRSLTIADLRGNDVARIALRTTLADFMHQRGDAREASVYFAEVDQWMLARFETHVVFSGRYRYYDWLLEQGRRTQVIQLASQTMVREEQEQALLDVALDHLALGRAHPRGSAEAAHHLNESVMQLRGAGQLDFYPLGVLARAANLRHIGDFTHAQKDLDGVRLLATRCGMRLHLTDYHLEQARLYVAQSQTDRARPHVGEARKLIADTSYHRRDAELAELEAQTAQR